ncbi:glycosyltransferase [Mycolicibacterium mucogenicum]|mgnify:CR=1 FL=1|uniref:glycosyltransferase n=1 Tax=Mycolicibacterium mucogenicum TaxID=56689 RepID=UPI002269CC28|nr:glycosyltransferase [Mycolicibacterium mucogenicum]MCX8553837.1 glycosyltransferase [Mycolicibacterium mucogenicum]
MTSTIFVNRTGRISGAETVLLRLVDEALSRGLCVRVVCPTGPLVEQLPEGVGHLPIDELDLGGQKGMGRVSGLIELGRRWRRAAKVIRRVEEPNGHIVINSLVALPAARLARPRRGVSWLVHDIVSDAKQRFLVGVSKKVIARTVAVSPPTADAVRALGIDVGVSPLGIHVQPARGARIPAGRPVVGIMGLLTPWKGHEVLLDALAKVPDVRCEIAGGIFPADQAYADELRRRAEQPPLTGRVSFLGHVDPFATMSRWDALVSASTLPEAGPIVAIEAMSIGVPVIATAHGGPAWLLRDGAGVLVPPGDAEALAAAITDTVGKDGSGLAAMVAVARQRVLDFHDATRTTPAMLDALLGADDRQLKSEFYAG